MNLLDRSLLIKKLNTKTIHALGLDTFDRNAIIDIYGNAEKLFTNFYGENYLQIKKMENLQLVLIDPDYFPFFPALCNYLNEQNLPAHGLLCLGIKIGDYIFRWTEYGIVNIISLQQFDKDILRKAIIIKLIETFKTNQLKKILIQIVNYNLNYNYNLLDKNPIQFIRDICSSIGINLKLTTFCNILKIIETQWKKYFHLEKFGILFNPYLNKVEQIDQHLYFLKQLNSFLQTYYTYSIDYLFEFYILKSINRTFLYCFYLKNNFESSLKCKLDTTSLVDVKLSKEIFGDSIFTEKVFSNNRGKGQGDDDKDVGEEGFSLSRTSSSSSFLSPSFYSSNINNVSSSSSIGYPTMDNTYGLLVNNNTMMMNGNNNTTTIDNNNEKPVLVLSLDGGGIKGIILSIMLIEIEKRMGRRISDMFDLVCGTSTGALCARGIQSGMSGEEIKQLYLQFGTEIFSSKKILNETLTKFIKVMSSGSWYEGAKLESLLLETVGRDKETNEAIMLNDLYNVKPKAFFVTSLQEREDEKEREEPVSYIFRTYPSPFTYQNEPIRYKGTFTGKNIPITQALRASSAAPIYFDRKKIGNSYFIDGGVTNNNPTEIAVHEMLNLWKGKKHFIVVSLGTGKVTKMKGNITSTTATINSSGADSGVGSNNNNNTNNNNSNSSGSGWFGWLSSSSSAPTISKDIEINDSSHVHLNVNTLLDIFQLSMSSEAIHRRVYDFVNQFNQLGQQQQQGIHYFRFNPLMNIDVPLDSINPEHFEIMTLATREYIQNDESFNQLILLLNQYF
ncbi:hypothetical protein ABK040_011818 [Willaertia magna]